MMKAIKAEIYGEHSYRPEALPGCGGAYKGMVTLDNGDRFPCALVPFGFGVLKNVKAWKETFNVQDIKVEEYRYWAVWIK